MNKYYLLEDVEDVIVVKNYHINNDSEILFYVDDYIMSVLNKTDFLYKIEGKIPNKFNYNSNALTESALRSEYYFGRKEKTKIVEINNINYMEFLYG